MELLNVGCGKRYHKDWTNVDITSTSTEVIEHNLFKPWPFADNSFDAVYHSHVLEHFPRSYAPKFLKKCYNALKPEGILRVVIPDFEQLTRRYLELLEKALSGDNHAKKCYEWIQLELFDQMVRDRSGGEMLEYMKQNPMPAEDFVIDRCGSEVVDTLSYFRNPDNSKKNKALNQNENELDVNIIGKFRLSGEVHHWMYDRYSLSALLKEAGFEHIRKCHANESSIKMFNSYFMDIEQDGSVRHPESLFLEAQKL